MFMVVTDGRFPIWRVAIFDQDNKDSFVHITGAAT